MSTRPRRRWPVAAAAFLALAAAGYGGAIATADDQPATADASTTAYGPSAFTDCLDDRDVPYRQEQTAEGSQLTPLGTDDPEIAAALEACNQLTSRPITDDYVHYVNAITGEIVDCMRADGYTIDTDTEGNGRTVEWTTVPADLGQTSQTFRDDLATCTSAAQMSVPSPAPRN